MKMARVELLNREELRYARALVGETSTDKNINYLLSLFYHSAEKAMLKARFPYNNASIEEIKEALNIYSENVDKAFIAKWNRRGAEDQTTHIENGVTRVYIDFADCFRDIVSKAKVI